MERPDLVTDPRFADREDRKRHRPELSDELNRALRLRSALEWETELSAAGVPAARILTVPQALRSEQLAHRGFFTEIGFPGDPERTLRASGNGVLVDGEPLRPTTAPPRLGEHNDETAELVRRWRDTGIPSPARPIPDQVSLGRTERD
ncbi:MULTISPECIES: CoA transferase [unclassified Amycolatopsis]|uniref:CoA transferase n=1 Tax=unclassified Amycolatopsis TaxID=2618356 RepID=UPI003453FACE